jgi:putative phosphoribosyl transferase
VTFRDRRDAGRQLADRLVALGLEDPVVLGLPRGGVPVAIEVARRLDAQVEVFVARKIGAPAQPELGIGAVAEGSDEAVTTEIAPHIGVDQAGLEELAVVVRDEIRRRVAAYRGDRALPELAGRDVVLVDDGLATGVTAHAALNALRKHQPRRLVVAVPTSPPESASRLARYADEVVWVIAPEPFFAVGEWYEDFRQVTDQEVIAMLAAAAGGKSH